jgi:hypothetical protein
MNFPGSLVLKFRQKFEHGLVAAFYRDVIRQGILKTKPISDTCDLDCEIHVLTSSRDWLNLVWTLKSFYWASGRRYSLCIHDDGTLTSEHNDALRYHFPSSRLIERKDADSRIYEYLSYHPRCLEFRRTNHLSPKLIDFPLYLESDRMLLLDSDILFFAEPTDLLNRIEDSKYVLNTVNGDVASAFTVDSEIVKEKCGFDLIERFNSGLGLIHKASLNLDWIEEFLSLPDIMGHFWRIEQTLYALCSSKFGVELLPPAYDVHLDGGINDSPSRHYVGAIRHLMYREGMRHLVSRGFLDNLKLNDSHKP